MTDLERARAFWLKWHGYITTADDVEVAALAQEFRAAREGGTTCQGVDGNNPKADAGYKLVPVTLVLHLEESVPAEWDAEQIAFYIEENHCLDNYLDDLARERKGKPDTCLTCHRGEAIVGHVKVSEKAP